MSWLAQNWIWVVVVAAVAWFFLRSSRAHGHAGGMEAAGGHGGGVGGLLQSTGSHHGGGHTTHEEPPGGASATNAPDAAIDPVSGDAVRSAQALSSVYQDKIYYFASKENRERFEAAPQEYAHKVTGYPLRAAEPAYEPPRRRRGGCC